MAASAGTHRYELRAVALMVRYVPVFVGVVLSTAFTLSVLNDSGDIARVAYGTGAELLGMYGGFGAVVLPFLFFASGIWRRGRKTGVVWAELDAAGGVVVELANGKRVALAKERVRSAYACPLPDGRTRVSLELDGGLSDGDRVVLELAPHLAEPLAKRFAGSSAKFDLAREGTGFSTLMNATSILGGVLVARALLEPVTATASRTGLARAVVDAGAVSWGLGLAVAAAGLLHAIASLATTPPTVAIGVDGVRIEGLFRRRFLPFRDIMAVRATRAGVEIELGRRSVSIFAPGVGRARLDALVAAIAEGAARSGRARNVDQASAGAPASVRGVRVALETSLEPSTYRAAPESDASLTEALLGPGLDRRTRLATAATLASRGTLEPIRIAAQSVADDNTRMWLERLSEEEADLASIEEAMDRAS